MEAYKKILNGACMVIGTMSMLVWFRALLHHQTLFFSSKGQKWVPTFVLALGGAWLFVFGLIGLVEERRAKKSQRVASL